MADFDVRLFGGPELQRRFDKLAKGAKGALNRAMRPSSKRIRSAIVAATPVDTGELKIAMAKVPIRALKGRGIVGIGIGLPPDARNAIAATVTEYGKTNQPPKPFIRGTVDRLAPGEIVLIGGNLGKEITKLATKG